MLFANDVIVPFFSHFDSQVSDYVTQLLRQVSQPIQSYVSTTQFSMLAATVHVSVHPRLPYLVYI